MNFSVNLLIADASPSIEQASYSGIFIVVCVVALVAAVVASLIALSSSCSRNADSVPRSTRPTTSNRKSGRTGR